MDFAVVNFIGVGMVPALIDPVLQYYSSNIKSFAYSSQEFSLIFPNNTHTVRASAIIDRSQTKRALMVGVSPSPLLDSTIKTDFFNSTTELGVTT